MKSVSKLAIVLLGGVLATPFAMANELTAKYNKGSTLQGDEKLACEAILCLSTSTRPSECSPSIKRYFSIKHKKFSDTIKGRLNFLKLCPKDNQGVDFEALSKIGIDFKDQETQMNSLTSAIVHIPHECSAKELNKKTQKMCVSRTDNGSCDGWHYRINPNMPKACKDLANHKWTIIDLPTYKGDYQYRPMNELTPVWFDPKPKQ